MAIMKAIAKTLACVVLSMLLVACASAPAPRPPEGLFNDHLFVATSERISADDVFAMSAEMKNYLDTQIATQVRQKGAQQGLFEALFAKRQLMLEYDSAVTRNAAQAFAARSGNCLSLVIMTAAFAKELGLPVRYQNAYQEETWSRDGDTYFFIGHVNVSLGRRLQDLSFRSRDADRMTIDFLPPLEIGALRTYEISEQTVVAMYMNNRAAEALARGQLDDAYAWARAAIVEDPGFPNSYNTLGVIYQRHGNLAEAQKVLAYALAREPQNTRAMSNLVRVLDSLGRGAEAKTLGARLAQLDPHPPFSDFNLGLRAMQEKNYQAARVLFAKEIDRAPYYDEFHFWLAAAYLGLGEIDKARKELALAMEYSTTRKDHDLYAAKLDRIMSHQLQ
jgi:tetratricopeptide (TPR) repeat protein